MHKYWQIIQSEKRPIKFLLSRILWGTGLSSHLLIKQKDYTLRFYPSSLSATLWINPSDRKHDEDFLRRYLRPKDVVIDVGANIGTFTIVASLIVGEHGKVFAIEPHPTIFKYLEGNIALNKTRNIYSYNVAIGDKNGSVRFSSITSDDQNSVVNDASGIEVPLMQIDHLPIANLQIALMKIDVEGFEKFVFQGAAKTLQKTSCVYFESWDKHFAKYGYTCRDVFDLLCSEGFQIFKLTQEKQISPVSRNYSSRQCENLLAPRKLEEFIRRTGFRVQPSYKN